MGKRALVLGGGAPNFTLMSGALLALHRAGVTFDLIYMAGAGGVVGLVYLAPKDLTPEQGLLNTMNYGISDPIYAMVPINYKLFNKGGPAAEVFRDYWNSLPPVQAANHQLGMTDQEKLAADWLLLQGAMMCPCDVTFFNTGICAHVPFIEGVVDFAKIKTIVPDCYLNAYCVEDEHCVEFGKADLDVHHFRAALSFPYIYPPYRIDGKTYYEGAAVESLNLMAMMDHAKKNSGIDQIVVFDVVRPNAIHRPRNLWDAYAQSIMVPLVANAEKELAIFMHWVQTGDVIKPVPTAIPHNLYALLSSQHHPTPPGIHLFRLRFDIPDSYRPYMLEWSKSNLETLFGFGYAAGQQFLRCHGAAL
jgi:predicted acylesterase/phospholipase RssA